MSRGSLEDLRSERLAKMGSTERAEFHETCATARLALEFGEQVGGARDRAGLSQRDLATRMGTSQAAVAWPEAGGVESTLTQWLRHHEVPLRRTMPAHHHCKALALDAKMLILDEAVSTLGVSIRVPLSSPPPMGRGAILHRVPRAGDRPER